MFVLDSSSSVSLVQQIVDGFSHLVDEGTLRSGAKLPSIRQFAHAHGVSVYTVVDAYDRLVAQGYFVSRPHLGFLCAAVGRTMSKSPQAVTATILTPCTTCAASSSTGG